MKLFELEATVTLDTSQFSQGADGAISKSGDIQTAIDNINTGNVDAEIAALDKEIASLDDEIHNLEMANLDEDIASYDRDIKYLESDLTKIDKKAAVTQGIITGLATVGAEVLKEAITLMIDFGVESLDYVANSGTEVGKQLKYAQDNMSIVGEALKKKVGTFLAPIAIGFYTVAESMSGITKQDKILTMFDKLESYKLQNLKSVNATLSSVFGAFEKYEKSASETLGIEEMTEGLSSQAEYWNEYSRVMESLQSKGVSSSLLASYADGSKTSLEYLQAIEKASEDELAAFNEAYSNLETARGKTGKSINEVQLEVDATVDSIISSIARIATTVTEEDASGATTELAQGIVTSLSSAYPSISSLVDNINSKIAELGVSVHIRNGVEFGGGVERFPEPDGYSTGLDYVPYDEFPAMLHEGEAVLTKAEADEWRKSSSQVAGYEIDYDRLGKSVAAALVGVSLNMDGQTVGRIVAPTVSREIATSSKARRYT